MVTVFATRSVDIAEPLPFLLNLLADTVSEILALEVRKPPSLLELAELDREGGYRVLWSPTTAPAVVVGLLFSLLAP